MTKDEADALVGPFTANGGGAHDAWQEFVIAYSSDRWRSISETGTLIYLVLAGYKYDGAILLPSSGVSAWAKEWEGV